MMITSAACGPRPLPQPVSSDILPSPDPATVESVLFLVGDPGNTITATSPTLTRLGQDVEWWAARLDADSSVAVVVLGDIIYPEGLREPEDASYDRDTAVVLSQVRLIAGPASRESGARLYFLAGNHDWGLRMHWDGYVRLRNLDDFLVSARAWSGASAHLVPEAGTGGPFVVDWGDKVRLVLLDTAWWLLEADLAERAGVVERIDEAFATAGDREMMLMAHHPFRSGGPHGGGFNVWEALGLRYILHRSGAILQDITSEPYRALEGSLRAIFAKHDPPLAFIGGHEHSLQVLRSVQASDPEYNLVSGSASKLSRIGPAEGMLFGLSSPGYIRLVIEKSGGITMFVEAAPPEHLECGASDVQPNPCTMEGVASFETVFSRRLR